MIHLRVSSLSLLLAGFLLAAFSLAAVAEGFYVGLSGSRADVKISKTHFNPTLSRLHLGGWIWKGIGMELNASSNANEDTQRGLTTEISQIVSVAARFQSPEEWGLKAYVLLGASRLTLHSASTGSDFPGSEDLDGGMVSLGLLAPITADRRMALMAQLTNYFVDSDNDIKIYSGSLGFHYEF